MKSVPELLARRAELTLELKRVNEALELLKDSTSPVEISTRKNLRNAWLAGVDVYVDEGLTRLQDISAHGGYICKADLAHLRLEAGDDEDDLWSVRE